MPTMPHMDDSTESDLVGTKAMTTTLTAPAPQSLSYAEPIPSDFYDGMWPETSVPQEPLPFYPEAYDDIADPNSTRVAVQPTTYREKRPTLVALFTGKEYYDITAQGYTAPASYQDTHNKVIGRIPISTAQGYTSPEMQAARAQAHHTGRQSEQAAPQPQFAAIAHEPKILDPKLSDYGFTPLELPATTKASLPPTPQLPARNNSNRTTDNQSAPNNTHSTNNTKKFRH